MSAEVLSYHLSMRGRPAGSYALRTQVEGRVVRLEARLSLQGALGGATVIQTSRLQRDRGESLRSLSFEEEEGGPHGVRRFEVVFDAESGLVRATRGGNDRAEIPYVQPYRDPLGLLYEVRSFEAEMSRMRIPMLGKEVVVERLGETPVDTPLGERNAYVYALRPGGSYLYVDSRAPHWIVRLTQRLEGAPLDASLMKVAEEAEMPQEIETPHRGRRPRKRRRRGRRGKG